MYVCLLMVWEVGVVLGWEVGGGVEGVVAMEILLVAIVVEEVLGGGVAPSLRSQGGGGGGGGVRRGPVRHR